MVFMFDAGSGNTDDDCCCGNPDYATHPCVEVDISDSLDTTYNGNATYNLCPALGDDVLVANVWQFDLNGQTADSYCGASMMSTGNVGTLGWFDDNRFHSLQYTASHCGAPVPFPLRGYWSFVINGWNDAVLKANNMVGEELEYELKNRFRQFSVNQMVKTKDTSVGAVAPDYICLKPTTMKNNMGRDIWPRFWRTDALTGIENGTCPPSGDCDNSNGQHELRISQGLPGVEDQDYYIDPYLEDARAFQTGKVYTTLPSRDDHCGYSSGTYSGLWGLWINAGPATWTFAKPVTFDLKFDTGAWGLTNEDPLIVNDAHPFIFGAQICDWDTKPETLNIWPIGAPFKYKT